MDRRRFLGLALAAGASPALLSCGDEGAVARMPVVFAGHGSPMNAITDNAWSRGFEALGLALPKPRAILSISAHWFLPRHFVTTHVMPPTIHDFTGVPEALHAVEYPAPGDPWLAGRVLSLLAGEHTIPTEDWGLDHGTWTVLRRMRPAADVPVVQVSLHMWLSPAQQVDVGRRLAPLREEGVLIFCSGNITHFTGVVAEDAAPNPGWAERFDADVASALEQRDEAWLTGALETEDGRWAHAWPDHYLPLLCAYGATDAADGVTFPIVGLEGGTLSMRAVRFG